MDVTYITNAGKNAARVDAFVPGPSEALLL